MRQFRDVLSVDAAAGTLDAEGMTTYEALTDACLARGVMPAVVPQLKTITLGGAVAGVGIEASSHRHGLVHDTMLELDGAVYRYTVNALEQGPSGSGASAETIAGAVRTELATELARLDAAISSRLATAGYTAPPSAAANASATRTELTTELGRIDAAISSRATPAQVASEVASALATLNDLTATLKGIKGMTAEQERNLVAYIALLPRDLRFGFVKSLLKIPVVSLSISREQNRRSGRNEGSTDPVATHPHFQRLGLARALLLTGLHKLKQRGMQTAVLGTSSENTAMQRAAQSVGFEVTATTLWFAKPVLKIPASV